MRKDLPFGLAEIDGEEVSVNEFDFSELAALSQVAPNQELFLDIVKTIEYSGYVPPMIATNPEEETLIKKWDFGYTPTPEDYETAVSVFKNWVKSVSDKGMEQLSEKGLMFQAGDHAFKTHQSLKRLIEVSQFPVEQISYRTAQIHRDDPHASPVLKSAAYAIQGIGGDWVFAEHFQSQNYIRFISVPAHNRLAHGVNKVITSGVKHSISEDSVSPSGILYSPFGVTIIRTNNHGAALVASAQRDDDGMWYSPYPGESNRKLLGEHIEKFGNPFANVQEVANLATMPYNEFNIRNGKDGWSLIGDDESFAEEVDKFVNLDMHSEADHIPDTIPEEFFE